MDVRTLCLSVLTMGDASGYEIKKRLEDHFRYFYDASFGSIYPALNRMQKDGFVTCTHEAQNGRPDKKVYRLTPGGRLELMRQLRQAPAEDRLRSEFLVQMMFADLLPVSDVAASVDQRLASCRNDLADLEKLDCPDLSPGKRFVIGYGKAILTAAMRYMEENRHLVESEALLAQVKADRGEDEEAPEAAAPARSAR